MQTLPHAILGTPCTTTYGGCRSYEYAYNWNRSPAQLVADGTGGSGFSAHTYAAPPHAVGFDLQSAWPNGLALNAIRFTTHYNGAWTFDIEASNSPGAWDATTTTIPEAETWVTLASDLVVSGLTGVANPDLTSTGYMSFVFANTERYLKYRYRSTTQPYACYGWSWSDVGDSWTASSTIQPGQGVGGV